METIMNFLQQTGFSMIPENWKMLVMIAISLVLAYLAIVKKFEPLLLLPISFGMLLTNLPGAEMFHEQLFAGGHVNWDLLAGKTVEIDGVATTISAGLIDYLYLGVKLGIFIVFILARLLNYTPAEAGSIGIIGGADGPTAIYTTIRLAPHLLAPIAVAAYSYMALVPVIQPPIMRALTTQKEREIVMKPLRKVSKTEKIMFPFVVTIFVALLVPSAAPLVGCLMLGNLMHETGVVDRLDQTVQNGLMNVVTIFLGVSVGATATANTFLTKDTLLIMAMGIFAFGCGTAGGVLLAKFMNLFLKEKINPLIGSAGVSAVPMAARVSQKEGQKANPGNFLLMHAMGPNVAGVIGSAIAAGVLLALFGAH